jgi:16S rRNA (guanine1516-N2)-methyltransferase
MLSPLGAIQCHHGDVRELLAPVDSFDTIYLDPMFPEQGNSALPRKSAQLLAQRLGAADTDLYELLARSIPMVRGRVVVKRRRHAAGVATADWQIVGRTVRFDVYRGSAAAS